MKVTPKKVQTVVRTVIKQTEQKAEQQSKQKENEKYLTNALEAMSNTNRVNVRVPEFIIKKEDVLAKRKSTITDGVKKYIENCNDNSAELDAIDTILSIIDKGETKLDKSILEGFCKDSKIPENLIKDLQKVKKGLNKCVPVVKNKEDALKKMETGDVFQIKGDDFVCIKNKKGEIEPLSMTKEDYLFLFNPVDRFASTQSKFGNCYEVTALNALMDNPKTRENILKCIDTKSKKGYIRVNLPNRTTKEPFEIKKEDIGLKDKEYYMKGARGFEVIECALGKEYEKELIDLKLEELKRQGKDSTRIVLESMYKNGQEKKLVNFLDAPNKEVSIDINLRDGGVSLVPWAKLGLTKNKTIVNAEKNAVKTELKNQNQAEGFNEFLADKYVNDEPVYSPDSFAEHLWSPEFFENNLVEASFLKDNLLLGLKKDHSYYLKPVLDKEGKIESYLIKDPHNIVEIPLSFEDATTKIDVISFAKIG